MSRKRRQFKAFSNYHIYQRGNNGNIIFYFPQDYLFFLKKLSYYAKLYGISVESYCLMRSHYHLVLRTGARPTDLSLMMHSFLTVYAKYFNLNHDHFGHVFQSRYNAKVINTKDDLIRVLEYLCQNPVKKNYVQRPEDYRWLKV